VSSVTGSTRRNAISNALIENTGFGTRTLKSDKRSILEMVLDTRACINHGKNSIQKTSSNPISSDKNAGKKNSDIAMPFIGK